MEVVWERVRGKVFKGLGGGRGAILSAEGQGRRWFDEGEEKGLG